MIKAIKDNSLRKENKSLESIVLKNNISRSLSKPYNILCQSPNSTKKKGK
jgi:hypothetical protein